MRREALRTQEQRPGLTVISGSGERFAACDFYLRQNASSILIDTRLSRSPPTMHFPYLHRALGEIELTKNEKSRYETWMGLSLWQAVKRGRDSQKLTQEQINILADNGDPAAHIVEELHSIQATNYPEIAREQRLYLRTFNETTGACAVFLASVHSNQPWPERWDAKTAAVRAVD